MGSAAACMTATLLLCLLAYATFASLAFAKVQTDPGNPASPRQYSLRLGIGNTTASKSAKTPSWNNGKQGPAYTSSRSLTPSKLAYVLLGSGTRDDLLVNILHQLRDHLLPWTPGDVLFFHTGEYETESKQQLITQIIPSARILRIPEDNWKLPAGLQEEDAPNWLYAPCCPFPAHGIGYRHMCRWYSNALFHYLNDLGYTWVFRLDEDSEVLTNVRQNVVTWMEEHGKLYAYRLWDSDDKEVIWSLPELTQWYITSKQIKPKWLFDSCRPRRSPGLNSWGGWDRRVIYNNMFMANIKWWLSQEVQDYLAVLEQSKGYYLYRWGDAPVHTMVIGLFLRRQQVHQFGFGYCHKANCDGARRYYFPSLREPAP